MCGKSERQLSAGRVSEHNDTPSVDGIPAGELAQELVSGGYVLKAARPSSSGIADTPEFEVPGYKASLRERSAKKAGVLQVVPRPPKTAVNKHRGSKRPLTFWKTQIAELKFVAAVPQARVSRRRSIGEDVLACLHARGRAYQLSSSSVVVIVMLRLLFARIVTARIRRLSEKEGRQPLSGLFAGMSLAGLIMQEFL